MVNLCLLKYLGSSLIDFHISTDKLSWFLLRGVPLFKNQDSKPDPVIAKAIKKLVPCNVHLVMIPVIRIQLCPTSSGV